ncbi:hypothetical protein H2248_005025, partial [Termitomyces sp. 'cryptogamus']
HLLDVLVVVRDEGWSESHGGKERVNHGDIMEPGPSTPKVVAGSIAKELAMNPRSKGKGKGKAREEEDGEEQFFFSIKCAQHIVSLCTVHLGLC